MVTPTSTLPFLLVHSQLMSQNAVKKAQALADQHHCSLLDYIDRQNLIDTQLIAQTAANYFGLEYKAHNDIDQQMVGFENNKLLLKTSPDPIFMIADPKDLSTIDPNDNTVVFIDYHTFYQLQQNHYSKFSLTYNTHSTTDTLKHIIEHAIHQHASDIHFESHPTGLKIRIRVDGELSTLTTLNEQSNETILSRLKLLANCDIAQKRLPQDGRFEFNENRLYRDCRLSSCPTQHGEKIVLRLLSPNQRILHIDELGLLKQQKKQLIQALQQPQGLILVTGPTGSGKTQTLYTMLNYLNDPSKNISSIEDPIEITMQGINQVAINHKSGLNYATVLKAFLRQDPDIIMIGEIRDEETAHIAIRAALTGHLVLATLHTLNAVESISRLHNMGIPHYNLSSTLICVIAQRLAKRQQLSGRIGIFEILTLDSTIKKTIQKDLNIHLISKTAKQQGMLTLWDAGLQHIKLGHTTFNEIQKSLPLMDSNDPSYTLERH